MRMWPYFIDEEIETNFDDSVLTDPKFGCEKRNQDFLFALCFKTTTNEKLFQPMFIGMGETRP